MMNQKNKSKALYIVENMNSAQFRYRVKNVAEALEKSSSAWEVKWILRSEIGRVNFCEYDLVVILRQTDKEGWSRDVIARAHDTGAKVLMDLDDLVFDYRDLRVLMWSTGSRNIVYWVGYFWGIRMIAKKVDGFLCTNKFLAKKLKRSFGKPVKVIRNSLNKEQIEVSERWVKEKNTIEKTAKFSIGYFSGSPTHNNDFKIVEDELVNFLTIHSDAALKVVGYMKFSNKMQKMMDIGRVEMIGLVDYLRLQRLISKVDVNIAPLVVNDFTNCKSELKFFEAAAVETTTIASPSYAFKNAITDSKNGFLAEPGDWCNKLEYLYKRPEKNKKIANQAKEYTLKHYYGEEFVKEIEVTYDYFAK